MNKEIKTPILLFFIFVAILLMVLVLQVKSPLTGFAIFEQSDSASFDVGGAIFENTTIEDGKIVLEEDKNNGGYTSQIFDSGDENSIWGNLTFIGEEIIFQIRSCGLEDCSDGEFSERDLENINLQSRYFQYNVIFQKDISGESPYLESVLINYHTPEKAPEEVPEGAPEESSEEEFSIFVISPQEGNEYFSGEILLNVSSNEEVKSWEYSINGEERIPFTPEEKTLELETGDYEIVIYAKNTLDEEINQSVSFTVLIPACENDLTVCGDEESCGEQGGYWYDERCNEDEEIIEEEEADEEDATQENPTEENATEETHVEAPTTDTSENQQSIASVKINGNNNIKASKGESRQIVLNVENNGDINLNSCYLFLEGSLLSDWISYSEDSFKLNVGSSKDLFLEINISEEATEEEYPLRVTLECSQISKNYNINIEIVPVTFRLKLIDVKKIKGNLRVNYEILDISGEDQEINVEFSIFNNESLKITETEEDINLSANKKRKFKTDIPINESLKGEMIVHLNIDSQKYSSSIEKSIVLDSVPILGFATFGDFLIGVGGLLIFIVVVFALISIVFFVKKIKKRGIKKNKKERDEKPAKRKRNNKEEKIKESMNKKEKRDNKKEKDKSQKRKG